VSQSTVLAERGRIVHSSDMARDWHAEVPGTRFFRADLHVHTVDDPPVRAMDPGFDADAGPEAMETYARRVLEAAIDQGIEVLGLTPHRAHDNGESAVMAIVELWRDGVRESGERYRDRVYAVYPGFEPNFGEDRSGVHLSFLFDPGMERGRYLELFGAVMAGEAAYQGGNLRRSGLSLTAALDKLDAAIGSESYVAIAPHAERDNGLLKLRTDQLEKYRGRILAFELRDGETREEALTSNSSSKAKLPNLVERGRALLHGSDAKKLPAAGQPAGPTELGHRFTCLKLGAPTIASLRQALLAPQSRVRIPYAREGAELRPSLAPQPYPHGPSARPWLRGVRVEGGTSFHKGQTFRFSPDLTCVIGGSMTGKSTLLDGLRWLWVEAGKSELPTDSELRRGIEGRGKRFQAGGANISLDVPVCAPDEEASAAIQPRFYSQSELQRLSSDQDEIERLLFGLAPELKSQLEEQRDQLSALDERLQRLAHEIAKRTERVDDAAQEFEQAKSARAAMERFAEAGTDRLSAAQRDVAATRAFRDDAQGIEERARALQEGLSSVDLPTLTDSALVPDQKLAMDALLVEARKAVATAVGALEKLAGEAAAVHQIAQATRESMTATVQRKLVDLGGDATELREFEHLSKRAQHFDSLRAALENETTALGQLRRSFERDLEDRRALTKEHRAAVQQLGTLIANEVTSSIALEVLPEGRVESIQQWVETARTRGVTRWWNGLEGVVPPLSRLQQVAEHLEAGERDQARDTAIRLGMTAAVAETLLELLSTRGARLELLALRARDAYQLLWVEDGQSTPIDELSGGRRASLLLMLLLLGNDQSPLVIDQPEDDLDNRMLNDTVIPALHRLKGKRQVIFATHNANLVVNGDADQVLVLEATGSRGEVRYTGSIDEPLVRDAIVKTLDGGKEAFELRQRKYALEGR
jgi:predicted  nucleic acid-binding Zn-ribbon protein